MEFDQRPWGNYTVLDEAEGYKVKRIEVLPKKRLSYQKHAKRAEHWFIVRGIAKVTLNDVEITVNAGESIDIPLEAKHRVANEHDELARTLMVGSPPRSMLKLREIGRHRTRQPAHRSKAHESAIASMCGLEA